MVGVAKIVKRIARKPNFFRYIQINLRQIHIVPQVVIGFGKSSISQKRPESITLPVFAAAEYMVELFDFIRRRAIIDAEGCIVTPMLHHKLF
jgi:hypothetical protein